VAGRLHSCWSVVLPFTSRPLLVVLSSSTNSNAHAAFLCDFSRSVEDGAFPMLRPGQDGPDEVAEERRLLYVAMTRAQAFLVSIPRSVLLLSVDS
jgi:hypothetical protein